MSMVSMSNDCNIIIEPKIDNGKAKLGILSIYSTFSFMMLPYLAVYMITMLIEDKTTLILFTERNISTITYVVSALSRKYFKYVYILVIAIVFITYMMLEKTRYKTNKRMAGILFSAFGIFVALSLLCGLAT